MYFWYKFITYLLYPLAPIYLYFRKLRKKEDPTRFEEKLSKINIKRENGFLIWFHVASVGESMSILPLIDRCIKEEKINKILITSITLSSSKILEKKFINNNKVIHQFLPLDIPILTNKFLNHWKPNLSIFIDSEIWPNLILQINKKKIPLLLVNGRITKKTFLRWKLFLNFAKEIFGKFDLCLVANKESENYLKIMGAKKVINHGNLKFSNIKDDPHVKLPSSFLNKTANRKTWCAAITHAPEELLCVETHKIIKQNYNDILTIIIPRHIDRINKIYKDLSDLNLKVNLFSRYDQIDVKTDILLVDSYGVLPLFYNFSKNVFLGKSLVKSLINDSGQNPIEPARQGCKIFHGPNVSNFVEIYKYLEKQGVTKQINNSNELGLSIIEEFKTDKQKYVKINDIIENYGQNILNNVIIELKKYI